MPQPKKTPNKKAAAPKQKTVVSQPKPRKTVKKSSDYRTLRLSRAKRPFLSTELTNQTFYWLLIGLLVLVLGGWIIHLQVKISDIYDKIDENQSYYNQIEELESKVLENRAKIEQNKAQINSKTE